MLSYLQRMRLKSTQPFPPAFWETTPMGMIRILLLLFVLGTLSGSDLQGAVRERGLFRRAAAARTAVSAPHPVPSAEGRQQPHRPTATWSMTPELYPQWYGGFHGRTLQNYGYPSGDLGIRGQAW